MTYKKEKKATKKTKTASEFDPKLIAAAVSAASNAPAVAPTDGNVVDMNLMLHPAKLLKWHNEEIGDVGLLGAVLEGMRQYQSQNPLTSQGELSAKKQALEGKKPLARDKALELLARESEVRHA